ncbi:hypothetical protein OAI07_00245 [Akkermansiaceae bacterium]|nr:hypothetical protein [Akkermansiaceae bacterium]
MKNQNTHPTRPSFPTSSSLFVAIVSTLCLTSPISAQLTVQPDNAVFNFVSQDPAGEGFNNITPRSEIETFIIGDNPGLTLGELRKNVLVEAGNRWSKVLLSDVVIQVDVDYQDFGGSAGGSITLAAAGAATLSRNFTNAPLRNTLYPIALANSLAGTDLSSTLPDINVSANSNSELSDSQEGNFTWYYGLDNNAPSGTIDFLNVMAHELGHGLGFSSTLNTTTGAFLNSNPDVFSRNIFDTAQNLSWDQMTSAQRLASATSDPNLTWNGPYVTGAVNGVSSIVSLGINNSSSSSTVSYEALAAAFGGAISAQGLSGNLILVDDGVGVTADLVEPIQNGAEVSGNIALIERGTVPFDFKVRSAQDAGAIGAIIYNNVANAELLSATAANDSPTLLPTIPITFVSLETANDLQNLLSGGLSVTIFPDSVTLTNNETDLVFVRRLRLFAPSTIQPGSSVSHWSTSASPNLLMEPSINSDIKDDLDLTSLLMKDIGWQTENISIPHLTYNLWLADTGFGTEATNTGQLDDFDGDGISNLEEYYHGSDPRSSNGSPFKFTSEGLTHQRSRLTNDINVTYQKGVLLTDFENFSVTESVSDLDSQTEEATISINTDQTREFFRISLEALDAE